MMSAAIRKESSLAPLGGELCGGPRTETKYRTIFRPPANHATVAIPNAAFADTRGTTSNIGNDATQVSHHSGRRPVPKKSNPEDNKSAPTAKRAVLARLVFEAMEKSPEGAPAELAKLLF
jgi:hypothetical protein